MSQVIPTNGYQPARVRTTYERVVANFVKPPFAYVALQEGTVLDIDEEIKMIKIEYKDKSLFAFQYGDIVTRYSGAGLHINQKVQYYSRLKKGSKFKKGTPIIYNAEYFMEDPFSEDLIWLLGKRVVCAFMDKDGTIDDSNIISKKAGQLLQFRPVHDRAIVMGKDFIVHSFMDVGKEVDPLTPLMVFEEFEDMFSDPGKEYDEETMRVIRSLNRALPKAESSGTILDIKVFYTSPISSMSPSMQKMVKHIEKRSNQQANFSKGTKEPLPDTGPVEGVTKLGTVDVTEDTVIVTYYIRDQYDHKSGDKSTLGSSGKSVTSYVMDSDAYKTEDGEHEIDHIFPGLAVFQRMIPETITDGSVSLVLAKLQKRLLDMYFK